MAALSRRDAIKHGAGNVAALALVAPLAAPSEDCTTEILLDEVKTLVEIDDATYRNLWSNLRHVTEEELDWRPHAQSNPLRWVVGHLLWFEEWVGDAIEGTGMYLHERMGPTSFQERPLGRLQERFDAARERCVRLMRALSPEDLSRELRFVYNEAHDGRARTDLRRLLRTHTTHMAGHHYQVRYIRGTYSRAHGTDKKRFDPW